MIRVLVAFVCLCASFEAGAQSSLSAQDVLLRAKASYDLTRRLTCDVDFAATTPIAYTVQLNWTRDGNRYRMTTGGAVDEHGEHIDLLIPTAVCIFDGQQHLTYTETNYGTGTQREALIHSGPGAARRMNQLWQAGLSLDGVLYGDGEDVFAILLRHTNDSAITATPVLLDDRDCIHIVAKVPEGDYELWLDPAADYRLRKSIVRKSGENVFMGKPINKSSEWSTMEATVTDIDIKDVPGGTLAVSGLLRLAGTQSPFSSGMHLSDGELYTFFRDNCRFGAILSAKDLTFPLPADTQVTARTE